jgi:hypothetical protein
MSRHYLPVKQQANFFTTELTEPSIRDSSIAQKIKKGEYLWLFE